VSNYSTQLLIRLLPGTRTQTNIQQKQQRNDHHPAARRYCQHRHGEQAATLSSESHGQSGPTEK
jgi:hypothetical protein